MTFDPITEFTQPIGGDLDGRTEADSFKIGGDWCPGRCTPRKAGDPRIWEKRKGWGFTGATALFTGNDLAEFEIDVEWWMQRQVNEFKVFFKKYLEKPPPKTRPKALGIYQPTLAFIGINALVVTNALAPFEVDELGGWGTTISVMVFRPPTPMLALPSGAIPAVQNNPTAKDRNEQIILEKQNELKNLMRKDAEGV